MALHTVASLGAFALRSAFWGAPSDIAGLGTALTVAAALMAAGLLLTRPLPLRMGAAHEVTQATHGKTCSWRPSPAPDDGPVAVEIAYRIRAGCGRDLTFARAGRETSLPFLERRFFDVSGSRPCESQPSSREKVSWPTQC